MRSAVVIAAMVLTLAGCKKDPAGEAEVKPAPSAVPSAPTSTTPAVAESVSAAPASASASASASAAASASAPSFKSFPGNAAGARMLTSEFVKPGADTAALSKQLRPTTADYKSLFDASMAAKIDALYSREWDKGTLVIAPKQGLTEVKLYTATLADLKAGTGNAKDFPGGWKKVGPHIIGSGTVYKVVFLEPGKDTGGFTYDGLIYVNGHWVLIPKPWRGLDDH